MTPLTVPVPTSHAPARPDRDQRPHAVGDVSVSENDQSLRLGSAACWVDGWRGGIADQPSDGELDAFAVWRYG